MSICDDAIQQLKQMYEIMQKNNLTSYNISRDNLMKMDKDNRFEMDRNFKFMKDEGWIKNFAPCVGMPISYELTSRGIKVAEDAIEKPVIQQTNYHIGIANNSIVGDNAHDNILNIGASFEDLKLLVDQNILNQSERAEILNILKALQDRMNSGKPLEKGLLSKINDKMESCSWLSSGIAALVLQYLSTLVK